MLDCKYLGISTEAAFSVEFGMDTASFRAYPFLFNALHID